MLRIALCLLLLLAACAGPGAERGDTSTRPRKVATRPRHIEEANQWFEKGKAFEDRGELREAIDAYARALEADELHGLAFLHKAENHLRLDDDPQVARILLKEALDLLPDNARAHLRYAEAAARLGFDVEAETYLKKAIALRSDLAEAHVLLAQHYEKTKRIEEAAQSLQAAAKTNPADIQVRVALVGLLDQLGRVDQAAQEMEAVAVHTKKSAPLYRRAADLHDRANRAADADRLRAIADEIDPPPQARKMRELPAAKPPPPEKKK